MMKDNQKCERCGSLIPAGTPRGECPGCLLKAGLNPNPGGYGPNNPPHDLAELARLFPTLEISEFIGRGGMGAVYKAVQRSLGRPVALKILSSEVASDPAFAERFNREAQALARLSHPNIVGVHESGRVGDLYYFIMEYVEGINLRQTMQVGSLSPESAMAIVPQVCDALQYAHDQGVVHRDVKPENILLDNQGRVKMADFGLAKLYGSAQPDMTLTGEQQAMGTYHYIAPEQMRSAKDVDHRADIYSLGVVFYEMLTGQIPMGHFPPPSQKVQVDVKLDQVVLRAMEQERERRYQKVADFKSGVENYTSTDLPATPPRAARGTRKLSALAVVGILGIPLGILSGTITGVTSTHELGMMAGSVIIIIGMILSGISWGSINANPDRLYGLRLARAGTLLPFTLVGGGLLITPLFVAFPDTQGDRPENLIWFIPSILGLLLMIGTLRVIFRTPRRAEKSSGGKIIMVILLVLFAVFILLILPTKSLLQQADETHRHRPDDDAHVYKAVKAYISRLDQLGKAATRKELVALVDPGARAGLLSFSTEEFNRRQADGFLGLIGVDVSSLPIPLSQFKLTLLINSSRHGRNTREFQLRTEGLEFRFPVHTVDGKWYLKVGPLNRVIDRGVMQAAAKKRTAMAQTELRKQVKQYLKMIDQAQKTGKLQTLNSMILPADLARVQEQGSMAVNRMAKENRHGLMGVNVKNLPAPMASFLVAAMQISGDQATVTISHGDCRIHFPMAKFEARWYLCFGKLEMENSAKTKVGEKAK